MRPARGQSLHFVVVSGILGLQLIFVVIAMLTITAELDRAIKQQSRDLMNERVQSASLRITNQLSEAVQTVNSIDQIARSSQPGPDDLQGWERELFRVLRTSPHASAVRLASSEGTEILIQRRSDPEEYRTTISRADQPKQQVIYRDAGFVPIRRAMGDSGWPDPRTQSWYLSALNTSTDVWTDAYRSEPDGRYTITLSRSFSHSDGEAGVIAVDIEVNSLHRSMSESIQDPTQALLIMDRTGHVIAYGDFSSFIEDATFATLADKGNTIPSQAFPRDLLTADPILSSATPLGGAASHERHLTVLQPLGYSNLPWLIGMHTAETSLTGDLWASRNVMPILLMIAFIATLILAIPLARRIIRPIVDFSSQTEGGLSNPDGTEKQLKLPYRELSATQDTLNREITQRRAFQIAYERTFDFSSRGMARIDPTTYRFLYVNRRLCELAGMSRDQLLSIDLWQIVDQSQHEALEAFGPAIISDREFTIDVRMEKDAGPETWLRMTALLIRNHLGNPDHALILLDDITQARSAEDRLDQLKRDLYHIGRVNMMGELAEGLAHELNQPLTAIVHDLDTAKYSIKAGNFDPDDLEAILTDIDSHAMRAGDIIRGLRNLIRKDGGQKEVFDLGELMEQTRKLMTAEARQNDVTLTFRTDTSHAIHGNRSQIAQVLVNLVRNAIEASVRMHGVARQVHVGFDAAGGRVRVIVEDNGPGIPKSRKPFTKFETTRVEGLGLGLSICKSLVEANDGTIVHENVEPHGARFIITLNEHKST